MNILVLPRYGKLGASSRLRLYQYTDWFENAGISCNVSPLITDDLLRGYYDTGRYRKIGLCYTYLFRIYNLLISRKFSLILIEKEALPWLPAWFEKMLLSQVPYVLDFDDAIFHNYDLHPSMLVKRLFGKRIDKLIANSRLVLTGNAYLANRAKTAGAIGIEIIPTVIDLVRYKAKPIAVGKQLNNNLRLVWIGSPSTNSYLKLLEKPLAKLAAIFPFTLRVIGGGSLVMQGVNLEILQWFESTESEAIAECDVGIMPLLNTPWEQGKCAYKLIQYMACGLPTVASPVGANRSVIVDGVTGFLADTDDVWVDKLRLLLSDATLRKKMGDAGRKRVETYYCLQQTAPILSDLLLKLGQE